MDGSTSLSLLIRARRQDPEAWARLVSIYTPLVYYWCRTVARLQPADAADVLQNTFIGVAQSIGKFERRESGPSFRSWLRAITRNKMRDHFRSLATVPSALGGDDENDPIQSATDPMSQLSDALDNPQEESERAIVIQQGLETIRGDFAPTTWEAFWRLASSGGTAARIGEELGISEHAVRQACYRVRKRLKEELEGLLESE